MRKILLALTLAITAFSSQAQTYTPTSGNLQARKEFGNDKLGIFLHWGIYSTFAQGEWYLQNHVPDRNEYAKAADAFYPHRFDALEWVRAIKAAGARYICFTSRHHDGFSMWHTAQSPYNIVDATPFHRDVIKELSDACHREGIRLHLYYSHIDWMRDDYPMGRTGRHCGKDTTAADWPHYYQFMNNQLTELLTNYGKIGAIWFDGWWDHDSDPTPFDWQLQEQYALIHRLQPQCLVGNNHHMKPFDGEDFQIFERDLPGENTAGFVDHAAQVSRLHELGLWMDTYGTTLYNTTAGPVPPCDWGATTQNDTNIYVHITQGNTPTITIPLDRRPRSVTNFIGGGKLRYTFNKKGGLTITLPKKLETPDHVIVIKK